MNNNLDQNKEHTLLKHQRPTPSHNNNQLNHLAITKHSLVVHIVVAKVWGLGVLVPVCAVKSHLWWAVQWTQGFCKISHKGLALVKVSRAAGKPVDGPIPK